MKILHNLVNTGGGATPTATQETDRQNGAYGPAGLGGETIVTTGNADNNLEFYFYNERAEIPGGLLSSNAVFTLRAHGADSAIPIPEGMFVVSNFPLDGGVNTDHAIGIDTTPYGTTNIMP